MRQRVRRALERGDALALSLIGHLDVDLRRADIDVPGELTDDLERDAALGELAGQDVLMLGTFPFTLPRELAAVQRRQLRGRDGSP